MPRIVVDNIYIEALLGDITSIEADAIVNAANSDLWMGSGVAGAILKKGGKIIEEEAMAQGPVFPGDAVITSAGDLPASYVIHCAGMPPHGKATKVYVKSSVMKGLFLAKGKRLKSIAIPAIGAGIGGLSYSEAWSSIYDGIKIISEYPGTITDIILVAYSEDSYAELLKQLEYWQ